MKPGPSVSGTYPVSATQTGVLTAGQLADTSPRAYCVH